MCSAHDVNGTSIDAVDVDEEVTATSCLMILRRVVTLQEI